MKRIHYLIYLLGVFIFINVSAQDCEGPDPHNRGCEPKNAAEWLQYIKNKIELMVERDEELIRRHFKEADLVIDGLIINRERDESTGLVTLEIEPDLIFKGELLPKKSIKVITSSSPTPDKPTPGEWALGR